MSCSDNAGFNIIIFSQRLDILNRTAEPMCVSTVKPSQEDELFCAVMKYFFSRSLLLSIYKNTSESSRACFRKKILNESTTLMCKIYSAVLF